jgi:sensor c-di-GMP phosphodiesterase-like protein
LRSGSTPSALGPLLLPPLVPTVAARTKRHDVTNAIDLAALQSAFAAREFFVVYQPIVALDDRHCVGAEALIRWRRNGAVVEARDFMALTDRTPLSGMITYWVIDTVASELGDWLASHAEAHIAINVPPEILGRGGVDYAATKSGLRERARQIIFEITERGVPDQLGLDALNSISDTGARVALDDTTLSGANLALLTRCRFDLIKIDPSLVAQLEPGHLHADWLDGLAALLNATQLQVIAEGVEHGFQAQVLAEHGVQFAQGRFFSAPLAADELTRFYSSTPRRRRST